MAFVKKMPVKKSAKSLNRRPEQLAALTGARGIAALWVVLFHYAPTFRYSPQGISWCLEIFGRILIRSGIAVSFFYVLSGFILTYTYGATIRSGNAKRFWLARFARIYPVYVFAFLLTAPLAFSKGWTGGAADKTVWSGLASVALLQSWFSTLALQWNPPAWSLSVEAFFYALFPFLLPRLKEVRCISYLFIVLSALSFAGLGVWVLVVYLGTARHILWQHAVCTFPLVRLPEFMMGCLAGILYHRKISVPRLAGRVLALALFLALVTPARGWIFFLIQNGAFAPVLAGLVLTLACRNDGLTIEVLSGRWVVLLGKASYSIYILQMPIWTWFHVVVARLFGSRRDIISMTFFVAYLACLVVFSLISFYFIEEPLRVWILAKPSSQSISAVDEVPPVLTKGPATSITYRVSSLESGLKAR